MTKEKFLEELGHALAGMPVHEIDEILQDYRAYFEEASAAGRNLEDVVTAHGDPRRLAHELRTELGFRQWEERETPRNFWNAAKALAGLITVDLILLVPGVMILGAIVVILLFVLSLLGIIGIGTLLDVISASHDPAEGTVAYLVLRSFAFLAVCSVGCLLLLALFRKGMRLLARRVRSRFQLLKPGSLSRVRPSHDQPKPDS